jgi:hypothetical protein
MSLIADTWNAIVIQMQLGVPGKTWNYAFLLRRYFMLLISLINLILIPWL